MQLHILLRSAPGCCRKRGLCGPMPKKIPVLISSLGSWRSHGPCLGMARKVSRLAEWDGPREPHTSASFDLRLRQKLFLHYRLPSTEDDTKRSELPRVLLMLKSNRLSSLRIFAHEIKYRGRHPVDSGSTSPNPTYNSP